jgi:predicted PurR-regulated permease PerM
MFAPFKLFTRDNLFALAFFIILITLLSLAISILSPFLLDFIWAVILAMATYPLYNRVYRWVGRRANLASFLLTGFVIAILVVPGFFVVMNLTREAAKAHELLSGEQLEKRSQWIVEKIEALNVRELLHDWGIPYGQTESVIKEGVNRGVKNVTKFLVEKVANVLKNLGVFALHAFFGAVALFFFFRDGGRYAALTIELLPLERHHQEVVAETLSRTVSAVVRGMLVTALVQGFLAGIGFAVAGLPIPILLGLLTFVNSFIPFLGAASVWIPASIWLFIQDQTAAGVGLALWGACVISAVDNVLKPLIIGGQTKIPVFLLFFTILGSLKLYGLLGIFLGPIILTLGMAFLSIYRTVYLEATAEGHSEEAEALQAPAHTPPTESPKP